MEFLRHCRCSPYVSSSRFRYGCVEDPWSTGGTTCFQLEAPSPTPRPHSSLTFLLHTQIYINKYLSDGGNSGLAISPISALLVGKGRENETHLLRLRKGNRVHVYMLILQANHHPTR